MDKPHPIDVCKSKVKYQSESIVQNVIFAENRIGSRDYYKCKICNRYHITSISNNNKRFDKKYLKEIENERNIILNKKTRPKRKGR